MRFLATPAPYFQIMQENDNHKETRIGFGVTPKEIEKKEKQSAYTHPAWSLWLKRNVPGNKIEEGVEYLSIGQILERLNAIADDEHYQETDLLVCLQDANFEQMHPTPANVFLWMVKQV